jgi:hypothetical protein
MGIDVFLRHIAKKITKKVMDLPRFHGRFKGS